LLKLIPDRNLCQVFFFTIVLVSKDFIPNLAETNSNNG